MTASVERVFQAVQHLSPAEQLELIADEINAYIAQQRREDQMRDL